MGNILYNFFKLPQRSVGVDYEFSIHGQCSNYWPWYNWIPCPSNDTTSVDLVCPVEGARLINGRCFVGGGPSMSFVMAVQKCNMLGGKVAEPTSLEDMEAIMRPFDDPNDLAGPNAHIYRNYWLGYNDLFTNNDFVYFSSGESVNFTLPWRLPPPNNPNLGNECVIWRQDSQRGTPSPFPYHLVDNRCDIATRTHIFARFQQRKLTLKE